MHHGAGPPAGADLNGSHGGGMLPGRKSAGGDHSSKRGRAPFCSGRGTRCTRRWRRCRAET
eukprot:1637990-Pleurochrysis_carterae.AAC.1